MEQGIDDPMPYLKDVMRMLADAPPDASSAYFQPLFIELADRYFGPCPDRYDAQKQQSNAFMLRYLPKIRKRVLAAEDPLESALLYARLGNYLDYGALGSGVDFSCLEEMLDKAEEEALDSTVLTALKRDLQAGQQLVYLCDNAGELVLDRLVIEVLKEQYPRLAITAAVRGKPVLNDALRQDAAQVGLNKLASIVDSGLAVGGVPLDSCSAELRIAIDNADLILAKGMGNFETLVGCGKNIYYLFLCKCIRFEKMFHVPRLNGIFCNEKCLPLAPSRFV